MRVDAAVSAEVLRAISPLALDAAFPAIADHERASVECVRPHLGGALAAEAGPAGGGGRTTSSTLRSFPPHDIADIVAALKP